MATYKVPQDVEADDKLIGPFTFRQFIYLIIVALAGALAWGLGTLFIPLAIIPLPIMVFFGALALPLRKDQPMEVYMAAMVSFFLKPHNRLWDPDGIESLIEITVPKIIEVQRTKNISQNEAQNRFSYLAEIVDSQGWAVRGPGVQAPNSALNNDVYFEAQQAEDIMDNDSSTVQNFDDRLNQSDIQRRQDAINMMSNKTTQTNDYFSGAATLQPSSTPESVIETPTLQYNPYPDDIQQSVIQPIISEPTVPIPAPITSEKVVPAGIINLASNTDLSIEAIAREANRIQGKQDMTEEVVISLR